MKERIKNCLKMAGLNEIPQDDGANLALYGFDSLLTVLTVAQLEKEFDIKIESETFDQAHFTSVKSLENYLNQLGVS